MGLLAGLLFAVYFLIGKSLRQTFDNFFIMPLVFFTGIVLSAFIILTFDFSFFDFGLQTMMALLSLALFPTILGHTSLIYVLKHFKVSFVSTMTLVEPVCAGIVAYYLFNEKLTIYTLSGYGLILLGLFFMINQEFFQRVERVLKVSRRML